MKRNLAARRVRYMVGVAVLCLGGIVVSVSCGTTSYSTPSPAPSSSGAWSSDIRGMPVYQPATVVSRTDDTALVLRTNDSVDIVGRYYSDAVRRGGWQTVSSTTGNGTANFTVKRASQGVTIAVAPSGSEETTISIAAYPA